MGAHKQNQVTSLSSCALETQDPCCSLDGAMPTGSAQTWPQAARCQMLAQPYRVCGLETRAQCTQHSNVQQHEKQRDPRSTSQCAGLPNPKQKTGLAQPGSSAPSPRSPMWTPLLYMYTCPSPPDTSQLKSAALRVDTQGATGAVRAPVTRCLCVPPRAHPLAPGYGSGQPCATSAPAAPVPLLAHAPLRGALQLQHTPAMGAPRDHQEGPH